MSLPRDEGTKTAFVDVLLDDCYRLWELPDDVQSVLDVGCHVGLFSVAARDRWPKAIIHAYEPNESMKTHWQCHASQVGFEVFAEAVGRSGGLVALEIGTESVQARTIEAHDGPIHRAAFRDVISRLGGKVDVVKLDCEGAEWPILLDEESWRQVRFLTMEFHLWAGYTIEELKSRVSKMGFEIQSIKLTGPDFGLLLASK